MDDITKQRFDRLDKKIELVDARVEAVDAKMDTMRADLGGRVERVAAALQTQIAGGFEAASQERKELHGQVIRAITATVEAVPSRREVEEDVDDQTLGLRGQVAHLQEQVRALLARVAKLEGAPPPAAAGGKT